MGCGTSTRGINGTGCPEGLRDGFLCLAKRHHHVHSGLQHLLLLPPLSCLVSTVVLQVEAPLPRQLQLPMLWHLARDSPSLRPSQR